MIGWSKRDRKQESREFVLDGYRQTAAALFMPGWDEEAGESGQCVRTALRKGCLDLDLPLIVVERDPGMAAKIKKDLLGLGFTHLVMHVGELSETPITHEVDFAFIDLLGTLDVRLCSWLRDELGPRLIEGATVAFSLAWSRRNNQFVEAAERAYNTSFPEDVAFLREQYHVEGVHKLIPVMLVRGSLTSHLFAFWQPMRYRDTSYPMMTFKFSDCKSLEGENNGSPSLDEVVSCFTTKERKTTMIDRSEAAHKAWQTRRNNEDKALAELERARLSANKAWDTRRAKTAETVRSLAAVKAWETRRENGWVHPAHR